MTAAIGPRPVAVTVASCEGCPALVTLRHASGVEARCAALTSHSGAAPITPYWSRERPAPSWCPARSSE